mgnify:FL=1
MKRCIASILAITILFSSFCYAMPTLKKNETVYINLGDYGDVEKVNIYSKCTTNGADEIIDYTKYNEVTNLSNRDSYTQSGDEIIWNVSGEKNFSYTGTVGEEYYNNIPWKFNISYKLNGVEVKPEELLGKSGLVKITIDFTSNENCKSYYRNNYILEVTASYDMSKYLSVDSSEAMITDTGNNKTLMFIVLPGQSTTLNIELGSDDFEMDGITMAMVALNGDALNKIADLVQDRKDIEDALDSINASSDVILNSLNGMNTGLNGISNGVNQIKKGTTDLHGLSEARDEDIENLKKILNDILPLTEKINTDIDNLSKNYDIIVEMATELNDNMKDLQKNIKDLNESIDYLAEKYDKLPDNVKEIKSLISQLSILTEDLAKLITNTSKIDTTEIKDSLETIIKSSYALAMKEEDEETRAYLLNIVGSAKAIVENIDKISTSETLQKNIVALVRDLNNVSSELEAVRKTISEQDAKVVKEFMHDLSDTSYSLEKIIDTSIEYCDKILENKDDFSLAMENAKSIISLLTDMTNTSLSMIDNINKGLKIVSSDIYEGSDKTADAILSLTKQLQAITNQTNQFKDSKNKIKDVVDNGWDKIDDETTLFEVEKDAKTVSFGDERNEVEQVQFIVKTPDIKHLKELGEDLEANTTKTTFWDRVLLVLKKMFGWIIDLF